MADENPKTIYDPVEVDADYFAENEAEQEAFYSQVKTLPPSVVGILFGEDTADIIESMAIEFGLASDQAAEVSRLVRRVLTAEVYLGDMVKSIQEQTGLDAGKSRELANAVVSRLFAPAIEDIKTLHASKFPGQTPQIETPPTTSVPPAQNAPTTPASANKFKVTPPPPPNPQQSTEHYQGEELPESNGNVIDLRNLK